MYEWVFWIWRKKIKWNYFIHTWTSRIDCQIRAEQKKKSEKRNVRRPWHDTTRKQQFNWPLNWRLLLCMSCCSFFLPILFYYYYFFCYKTRNDSQLTTLCCYFFFVKWGMSVNTEKKSIASLTLDIKQFSFTGNKHKIIKLTSRESRRNKYKAKQREWLNDRFSPFFFERTKQHKIKHTPAVSEHNCKIYWITFISFHFISLPPPLSCFHKNINFSLLLLVCAMRVVW